jgi:hypothetical protein
MEVIPFAVFERASACQDLNLKEKNLEYLEGMDFGYFRYVAEANAEALEGENKHRAAVALRVAHHQGLETLFALLGALIQAPHCVVGWMLAYKTHELKDLVEAVSTGRSFPTALKGKQVRWEEVAMVVHGQLPYEQEKTKWIQDGFGKMWRRFAGEFLDEAGAQEYNSIKHGMRARPGGFTMSFRKEESLGVVAPGAVSKSLGGSVFGTSFYYREKLTIDKFSFRPRSKSLNWDPQNLINSLVLISMSIQNIIGVLRINNGVAPEKCQFTTPDRESAFLEPWRISFGVTSSGFDLVYDEKELVKLDRRLILGAYHDKEGS